MLVIARQIATALIKQPSCKQNCMLAMYILLITRPVNTGNKKHASKTLNTAKNSQLHTNLGMLLRCHTTQNPEISFSYLFS